MFLLCYKNYLYFSAQIIFITIILTADNAIIIGVISANFIPKNKKQIIYWGVAGALIFKIIFALICYLFIQILLYKNFRDYF